MSDLQQPHSVRAEMRVLDALMHTRDPVEVEQVAALVGRADFYQPRHAELFDTILALHKEGAPTSADAVAERMAAADVVAFAKMGGGGYLATIVELDTSPAEAGHWAHIVVGHARTRAAQVEAIRYGQVVESGDLDRIQAERLRLVEEWSTQAPGRVATGPRGAELDAFLAEDDPDHDWLIPGLIERGDRLILTGNEGMGKSTLLRQIGVQAASGIHPFGGPRFPPLRVLRLDVENGARRERRELRALRIAAGDRYAGGMVVISRIQGLDLTQRADVDWLAALAEQHDPDLMLTGPAYKMHAGDPNDETAARVVAGQIDRLRAGHGCAVLLEAHSPHASNGGRRPIRPYGASYWLRWPEFGIHLGDDGTLTHWRGPRDEREWPAALQRGGSWPWTAVTRERDILWAQIKSLCVEAGDQLSTRDLAQMTGKSQSSISRVIRDNAAGWAALASSQVKRGDSE